MKCISSPALDDLEIIRYVEGEADDAVVTHIQECPFCREKANRWAHLQNNLQKQGYRAACPTAMELGDYHLGLLPAPQVLVIAQHLRECPLCRREVAELEEFLVDESPEPGFLGTVKVLIARLLNDAKNLSAPTAVALRGETKGPLTLEADDLVITLEVNQSSDGQISLVGQLAADDQDQWTGARVELQQADASRLTASVDDLGAFRLEEVSPGAIQITIKSLHNIKVEIPNIEITD